MRFLDTIGKVTGLRKKKIPSIRLNHSFTRRPLAEIRDFADLIRNSFHLLSSRLRRWVLAGLPGD